MINAKERPPAISHWNKCGRSASAVPKIENVEDWSRLWRIWWVSLQPQSRDGDKLLRVVTPSETWPETRKGSINGFYSIVVSLGWWMEALKSPSQQSEFSLMLADVQWVLGQMLGLQNTSAKRPFDAIDDNEGREGQADKRYII
jgi:hypothetical protein